MHQSTTPSLSQTIWARWASRQFLSLPIVETFLPVTFGYSLSLEAVVMRQLRRWKRLWRRSLTRSHKMSCMDPCRSCWNDTSALQPEEITSKGDRSFMCVLSIKVAIQKKSGNLLNDPRTIVVQGLLLNETHIILDCILSMLCGLRRIPIPAKMAWRSFFHENIVTNIHSLPISWYFISSLLWLFLSRSIGKVGRVFASGQGELGLIPGRVIPKTLKMVLGTALLNTQQYKACI